MTVTEVRKDRDAHTMSIESLWPATVERVWQLWADPRQLERWWGPPGYPASVSTHDLVPGGTVRYAMTGPEGEQYPGWWKVVTVEAPHRLVLDDGFAESDGAPDPDLPVTRTTVTLEATADGGTRMVVLSTFTSTEDMDQILSMGAEEGFVAAMGQIDAILAGD
jgi:uncharacterized protein YndB with AHSA1/START domain